MWGECKGIVGKGTGRGSLGAAGGSGMVRVKARGRGSRRVSRRRTRPLAGWRQRRPGRCILLRRAKRQRCVVACPSCDGFGTIPVGKEMGLLVSL